VGVCVRWGLPALVLFFSIYRLAGKRVWTCGNRLTTCMSYLPRIGGLTHSKWHILFFSSPLGALNPSCLFKAIQRWACS
jgi:hypothetical protein